tara:strand:- start:68638 stop:70602 length:1965 start_codon:yes stop_codon:yes gene_type:complete
MAVTGNILSEINDEVIFTMDYPINEITAISAFTDGVTGVTATRLFDKEFRYTLDGINWTIWEALSDPALAAIPIAAEHDFQAQFKYKRVGADDTGNLVFEWLKLDYATTVDCVAGGSYFEGSIFSYFFDGCCDEDVKKWCMNVLNKMYKPGIVSKSLTRGEGRNLNFEDEDYIAFWKTVSCFFAMHVTYARGFENFDENERLLVAYLTNQAIIVNRTNEIADMQYIMANLYSYARHRGTPAIGNLKSRGATVNGELPNLVQFDEVCDEFLLDYSKLIWRLNDHSPLYRGIDINHFRKSYQNDLGATLVTTDYPILPDGTTEVVNLGGVDPPNNVIKLSGAGVGELVGIGLVDPTAPTEAEKAFLTSIDPDLVYEINFLAKGDASFTVAGYGFTSSFTEAALDTINPVTQTRESISRQRLAQSGEWYMVRVLLLPASVLNEGSDQNLRSSLGIGYNLRMPAVACKFGFGIAIDRTAPANNEPTVSDSLIELDDADTVTLTLANFLEDYNDAEGDPVGSIQLDSIAVASGGGSVGTLVWGVTDITATLPQTIPVEDIANGLLKYTDAAGTTPQNISLVYTVLDNQPQAATGAEVLYIKDITFKLAVRPYGIGITNGVNIVETYLKNNSGKTSDEIESTMKQSLLPYNVKLKNNYLS